MRKVCILALLFIVTACSKDTFESVYSVPEEFQKEALIFLELGNCFLHRDHEESLPPNSDPKSMMVKDNIGIYSLCISTIGGNTDYNLFRKELLS